jgi:hypothetical protein
MEGQLVAAKKKVDASGTEKNSIAIELSVAEGYQHAQDT